MWHFLSSQFRMDPDYISGIHTAQLVTLLFLQYDWPAIKTNSRRHKILSRLCVFVKKVIVYRSQMGRRYELESMNVKLSATGCCASVQQIKFCGVPLLPFLDSGPVAPQLSCCFVLI